MIDIIITDIIITDISLWTYLDLCTAEVGTALRPPSAGRDLRGGALASAAIDPTPPPIASMPSPAQTDLV